MSTTKRKTVKLGGEVENLLLNYNEVFCGAPQASLPLEHATIPGKRNRETQ